MANKRNQVVQLAAGLVIMAAVVAAMIHVTTREDVIEVTASALERGRVEQTITAIASGTVMADQEARVAAGYLGTVAIVHVDQGQRVAAGELLVEFDHEELDAQVALAEANLRVGQSRLEQAKLGAGIYEDVSGTRVSQTEAQLNQARNDFNRVKALYDQSAVSQAEYDRVSLALRVAQEAAAAATASSRETMVRTEEIRLAEAMIEQLEAAVHVAKAARERALIRAPFDGVVAKLLTEAGEAAAVGMPLLTLVNTGVIYVEAPFDEANAAEIAVGQTARLNIDSHRDVDFYGTVDRIDQTITLNPDLSRTLNARIRIEENAETFLPGMSVDVVIIVDEKEGVLFAPTESIVRQQYAYVVEGGRAVRRDVTTGVGNWNTVEVIEGLTSGDSVITSVSVLGLKDGVRVKVVEELEGL